MFRDLGKQYEVLQIAMEPINKTDSWDAGPQVRYTIVRSPVPVKSRQDKVIKTPQFYNYFEYR